MASPTNVTVYILQYTGQCTVYKGFPGEATFRAFFIVGLSGHEGPDCTEYACGGAALELTFNLLSISETLAGAFSTQINRQMELFPPVGTQIRSVRKFTSKFIGHSACTS